MASVITLEKLIQGLGVTLRVGEASLAVRALADDSREVEADVPGTLFIARTGPDESGEAYLAQAIERGASAVLTRDDAQVAVPKGVAHLTATSVDQALTGRLAERFFGEPSKQLRLVGVTGTSGKTTTAWLVQHLLNRLSLRCGLIGTIVLDDGRQRVPAELTTPGALAFSRLLAAMVANGCRAAVAEVSSHALHQGRTAGLTFDVGVLTNLTGDHLDYHGDMEQYAAAKAILFEQLGADARAIVNGEDAYAQRMIRGCAAPVLMTRLDRDGTEGPAARRRLSAQLSGVARVLEATAAQTRAELVGPWGELDVRLPLVGSHNVANTLQAVAAAASVAEMEGVGTQDRALYDALVQAPPVPGRLERVTVAESNTHAAGLPTVLVDYAHKTDALENVLSALRPLTREGGSLVCVFGCGGDRDRTKRPQMAEVACRLADRVVVTSDNPRTEDPGRIIDDVLKGTGERAAVVVEPDRAKAIRLAIEAAGANDTVLIAGKGHEDYQIIGKQKRHFDDREQAAAALAARVSMNGSGCEV